MADLYVGLVHYPIYNKRMNVIAGAVTNFDIHDISRTCRTYNVQGYYIIHPLEVQKQIIDKILSYWQEGYGKVYNPDRADALSRVLWQPDIASAVQTIVERTGKQPYVVTTDARIYPNTVSYSFMRKQLQEGDRPVLLLFGTGFGIEAETMAKFDYILEPVYGPCDYNHLCVRSAVAIILDRLAGEAWWEKIKEKCKKLYTFLLHKLFVYDTIYVV